MDRPVSHRAGVSLAVVAVVLWAPLALAAGAAGTVPPSSHATGASVSPGIRLVKNITVGNQPSAPTADPANGDVYVANSGSATVTVINGTTNRVVHTVTVGTSPRSVVYNPTTNELYVINLGSNNVTVISGASNSVVATVAVRAPLSPVAAFDPANGDVFVLSGGGSPGVSFLTKIDRTSYSPVVIPVGPASALAYDPGTRDLVTANALANNLSVVGPRATIATTVSLPVGDGPAPMSYDPFTRELYVSDTGITGRGPPTATGNVSILSPNNTIVATLRVPQLPVGTAYDPHNHDMYTVSEGFPTLSGKIPNGSVTVISTTHSVVATLAIGKGGALATYDPVNHDVYVACSLSNATYVIDGGTNAIKAAVNTTDYPLSTVYDPATKQVLTIPTGSSAPGVISVLSPHNVVLKLFHIGSGTPGVLYVGATGTVYVSNSGSGTVTVLR